MRPDDWNYRLQERLYRLQRRRIAVRVERLYRELLDTWDQSAFRERMRPFWNPFPDTGPAKFLDLNVWFREAIFRYVWTGVPRLGGPLRVLDLGAGTGYFMLICRHMKHEVLGLDLDTEPLYNECFDFFKLPRVVHCIRPLERLPDLPGPFDLITAFMTCFDVHDDGSPWGGQSWQFLLGDLRQVLALGGRVIIRFNANPKTGEFYSREVRRTMEQCVGFRARFFLHYAFLQAV
jgi:SAM-dependent methyltransferase